MISDCSILARLHAESLGIGAKFDSEYSAQARLSNSISPSDFPKNSEATAKQLLAFIDGTKDMKFKHPVLMISLIPCDREALSCTYKESTLLVTRIEPSGNDKKSNEIKYGSEIKNFFTKQYESYGRF